MFSLRFPPQPARMKSGFQEKLPEAGLSADCADCSGPRGCYPEGGKMAQKRSGNGDQSSRSRIFLLF
jgi:hypothetical protein